MIKVLVLSSLLMGQAAPQSELPGQGKEVAVQALQDEGQLLTLEQAIARAKEHNLDLQVARARLAQAKTTSAKVWSAYLPQLAVGASYTRNNVEAAIALPSGYYIRNVGVNQGPGLGEDPNVPGGPTSLVLIPSGFATAVIQAQNQFGGQITLNQALLAPQLWPAIGNAYLLENVAELNVDNARQEILFAVAQLYYGAAGLKESLKVQSRLLGITRQHEKDAQVRYQAGALPKAGLLRAEIDRARAEQDLKRSENAYLSAKVALSTLLDGEARFTVELPPEPQLPQDVAGFEDAALRARPDVAAARVSLKVAEGQRTGVYLSYLPSLGLSAQYRLSNATGFTGRNDSWAITLGLNWTLFDGGLREANLREAGARVTEAEAGRRSTERKARDEVTRAKLDLDSAFANRVKAAEQLRLARENTQLVNVSFQSGVATYLEVSDANGGLLGAELNAVAESLNANLAALRLLKSAGAFNP